MNKVGTAFCLTGLMAASYCIGRAQQTTLRGVPALDKIGRWEAGPQMVGIVNHTDSLGRKIVIFPEVVPILVFKDAEEFHSAPLPNSSRVICRMLYDYKNSAGFPNLAFACGSDQYVTDSVALMDRREARKYLEPVEGDPESHRNLGIPAGRLQQP